MRFRHALRSATALRSCFRAARAFAALLVLGATLARSAPAQDVTFGKSTLQQTPGLDHPTSLAFGPDGRLYLSQQNGLIRIYEVTRNGADDYAVSAEETIDLIQSIPNHDDDGSLAPGENERLVTGILVTGTSSNPVLYVSSSDPRIANGMTPSDPNQDTNSGMVSRLTWTGSAWQKLDLVRGLPRSKRDHASHGMALDESNGILYLAQGGNTNMGAPSASFLLLPEYALSGTILAIDLDAIGETTYDLPTLDDEDRPGTNDANDPFGGNAGKNQAIIVPGGPVQIHATGLRNPYDLLITRAGHMYTSDNGPNADWGDVPVGEGTSMCTNDVNEPGSLFRDNMHYIPGPGFYAGHPNPTRGWSGNTFNPSNPQSPVQSSDPDQCDFRTPDVEDNAIASFHKSTNGLTEYTTTHFGGALDGNILAASFDNRIWRIVPSSNGATATLVEPLFETVGMFPLDVRASSDDDPFPGTIWVADHRGNAIIVFEPVDDAPACAQPVSSGPAPVATDCLFILRAAVGSETCSPECVCAPTGTAPAKATDALLCLQSTVGIGVTLDCPCGG